MKRLTAENVTAGLLFIFLIFYPLMASAYNVLNMSYFLSMVFLSLSLALIWGLAGIFSFGQTAFFGIGGYSYAIISLNLDIPDITFIVLISALLIAGIAAWILGYFIFYGGVNDVFVGLITLCVTLVLATFMSQTAGSQWKIGSVPLGGDNGINNIPSISIGNIISFERNYLYYLILIVLVVVYLLLRKISHSKSGYKLIAVRENRERSELFGYNIPLIQTMVFTLGGVLAALSGVFYVTWGGYISPSSMGITAAALPVVLVAAAGRKNLTAVILFTIIYYMFSQYLSVTGSEYALVVLGFTLVVVILLVPQGVFASLFQLLDRLLFKKK